MYTLAGRLNEAARGLTNGDGPAGRPRWRDGRLVPASSRRSRPLVRPRTHPKHPKVKGSMIPSY